ncbi:MAG: hypothetical protein LC749_09020 [Actinobacteria bacterium]|nr:hypothetical protein [Actinomycetota bacterium]
MHDGYLLAIGRGEAHRHDDELPNTPRHRDHRPPEHWQFLLAAQLVERGHEVRYPTLPEPDAPQLERWLDVSTRSSPRSAGSNA